VVDLAFEWLWFLVILVSWVVLIELLLLVCCFVVWVVFKDD